MWSGIEHPVPSDVSAAETGAVTIKPTGEEDILPTESGHPDKEPLVAGNTDDALAIMILG